MASIDGLGSGLDTTTIVSQLMATERLPQQRLQQAQQAAQSAGAVWLKIKTAMASLQALSKPIADPTIVNEKFTATSSDATVLTAKAATGASQITTDVTVTRLAKALQLTSGDVTSGVTTADGFLVADTLGTIGGAVNTANVTAATGNYLIEVKAGSSGPAVSVNGLTGADADALLTQLGVTWDASSPTLGTATVTVVKAAGGTSAADFARQVNAQRGALSAVALTGADQVTKLVLTAATTGTDSRIQISGLTKLAEMEYRNNAGAASTSLEAGNSWTGTDAVVAVGGVSVVRGTNTITDVLPGITLDLLKEGGTSTVTVKSDAAGNAATVKGLVDAMNSVLREISAGTKYDPATKKSSPLTGNSAARSLTRQLQDAVSKAGSEVPGISLGQLGIKVQQDGTYSFDEATLTKTLAANPTGVADLLKKVGAAANEVAGDALHATSGLITSSRELADSRVSTLQKRVDEWDVRLAAIERRLTKQFTSLDSALGNLNSQGNWLAGQLAGLPQMYS